MELRRGRPRKDRVSRVALLCFISLCFLSVHALLQKSKAGSCYLDIRSSRSRYFTQAAETEVAAAARRRRLGGPGSYPPRCAGKCGRCTPCRPVHVPVPPGTPVVTEYYPEAWRCKCGNRLYMP